MKGSNHSLGSRRGCKCH